MIKEKLVELISATWLKLCDGEVIDNNFVIEEPPKNIQADFATNICFQGARLIKNSPIKIAEKFIELINENKVDMIEDIFIAGPGFVNFILKKELFIEEALTRFNSKNYVIKTKNSDKILIEFVSANPTGPLHIGHARGAAIGDSLARILTRLGHAVDKEYYVNNAGNQIDVLAKTLDVRYQQLQGKDIELPDESYRGKYMIEIAEQIGIQSGEIDFKKIVIAKILDLIEGDLKKFNIDFHNWFLETSLIEDEQFDFAIERLKRSGHLKLVDGAWWLMAGDLGDDDKNRVVIRQDGRPTYFATDIAYHANKFKRGYDKLINIWGADHHGYVARIKAAVSYLGHEQDDLNIVLYNLVSLLRNGQKIPMSTRAGEFISLAEVINEVGVDATRFFLLMRDGNSSLDFDLELAKAQSSDNPVYYVQYARARIFSILRKASEDGVKPSNDDFLKTIKEKEELNLIKMILKYSDIVALAAKECSSHHISMYLQELAAKFHNYYAKYKISEQPGRLILIMMIADIIADGLDLLGVSAPDRM
ncbi:MAG: arginine--tRNA ligase [bacterium]|nr:arginine--tRNA ligase [bacterium]